MKKEKKNRKVIIPCLISIVIALLIAIGFIPVKRAVYADKDDERRYEKYGAEYSLYFWYNKEIDDSRDIIETSDLIGRPNLKESGTSYIGEYDEYYDTPVYYEVRENSPLSWLNTNFNPDKVKNYFAIRYYDLYWIEEKQGEMREGYYNQPIVIKDWTPTYPIQRSGWLASRILPKDYLVIWDFIGPRAVSE